MKRTIQVKNNRVRLLSLRSILVFCMMSFAFIANSQTICVTSFANNNGNGKVTFNFQNTNAYPVLITDISSICSTTASTTTEAWYIPSALNVAVSTSVPVLTSANWTQFGNSTISGVLNTTTTTPQSFFNGGLSLQIPAGATYAICVNAALASTPSTGNLRYSTVTAGAYTFSGGGCNILTGTNIGHAGAPRLSTTAFANTPRGFIGCVTFVPAVPCSGTPSPGNTVASSNPVCSGAAITLSLQNSTSGTGVTFQWQTSTVSSSGPWTNVGTSIPTYSTSQSIATWYRSIVSCSGSPGTSTPLLVSMNSLSNCYCTPTSTNGGTSGDAITGFSMANLSYTTTTATATPGYLNLTAQTILVGQGIAYNTAITQQYSGDAAKVWVDFNDNGSFEDAGEVVLTTGTGTSVSGTISISASAPLGNHRLRVRNADNSFNPVSGITSCSSVSYGETKDFTLTVVPASYTDAAVTNIYSLGKLPLNFGSPHVVKARVANLGATTLTSYPVTLSITGANTFTNVQNVTIAPGATTIVTFAGFTPTNTGTNTLIVSVPSGDAVSTNDSQSWSQVVTTNLYSYKNTALPNDGGVGFTSATGDFVGKFTTSNNNGNPDTINEIKVDLTTSGLTYQIGVWSDNAGVPGTNIWTSANLTSSIGTAFIPVPNLIVTGSFFVGVKQTGTTNIGFAYQTESPIRTGTFYYTSPTGGSTWTDFGSGANPFRFSIEVQLYIPQPPNCALALSPASGSINQCLGTQLSWASGGGGPTGYDVYFGTSANPPLVASNQPGTTYTPSTLLPGTTYYWNVIPRNADGAATGCGVASSFTTGILLQCYCTPVHTGIICGSGIISNVTMNTINNTTSCSTPAYTQFPNSGNTTTTLEAGKSYNLSVTCDVSSIVSAWIDFNRNGAFESSEWVQVTISSVANTPNTVLINVPVSGLSPGLTVMRIRSRLVGNPNADGDACTSFGSGETEDYYVNLKGCSASIAPVISFCPGTTININATYLGTSTPSTYSWTGPNGYTSIVEDPSILNAGVNAAGTYNFTVTDGNGCVSNASVNVNSKPVPIPTAASNSPVCEGTVLALIGDNDDPLQINGNSYVWSGPSFASGSQSPTVTGNAAQINGGTYTVTVTNSFGCTASTSTAVVVSQNPVINLVTNNPVSCNGGNDGYIEVSASNGTPMYLYSNGFDLNFDGQFSGLSAGSYDFEVTDENSCMGALTLTVTEPDPTTLADAGSDQSICFGTSATISGNTPVIGIGSWSLVSGSGTISNMNSVTTSVTSLGAGVNTFRWTITNVLCGNSNFDDVTITTIPLPTALLSGSQNICSGGSANLTINFTGNGPWTYAVNGGSPLTTSSNPKIISVSPAITTSYSITSFNDANCTGTFNGTATVSVSNAPPASTVFIPTGSYPASGCVGNLVNVSCNTVPGATSYNWSVNSGTLINGLPGPVSTSTPNATLTLGAIPVNVSNWEICVFAANACGVTNTKCFSIRGNLSTPGPITGSAVACPLSSGVYSTSPVAGATGYLWTGTNGITFTGSGTTVTANFPSGFSSGSICVAATLNCGYVGSQRCMTITNSSPALGQMSGPFSLCPGAINQVFSVPAAAGVASYTWSVPANVNIVSGQGTPTLTVNVGAGFTQGQICVYATSNCGIQTAPRCKTMYSTAPLTPGNISGMTTGVCGQTITYSITPVAGVSNYTWTNPSGATFASPNGSSAIDVNYSGSFTTGQLCVAAVNGCGSSPARCVSVKGVPADPLVISGPVTACANEQGTVYSIGSISGSTGYLWTVPAGAVIYNGQGSTSIVVDWGTTSGSVTVRATNSCGTSGTKTLSVNIGCKVSGSSLPGTIVNAYPNPTRNVLNVELNSEKSGIYTIELTDLSGRVIYQTEINVNVGVNHNSIDVSKFTSGIYILGVHNVDGFVKQIRIGIE